MDEVPRNGLREYPTLRRDIRVVSGRSGKKRWEESTRQETEEGSFVND